jgi:hypothetical protein
MQSTYTGNFAVSSFLHPLLNGFSNHTLEAIERSCWWLHITGIFAFLNYLPFSKHLHIIFAFPNAYYVRLEQKENEEYARNTKRSVVCDAA